MDRHSTRAITSRLMKGWIEDDAFYADIAGRASALRQARGLSQRELAEMCGTTQSAIARFEAGARPPKLDTLLRIASALDAELVVELRPRTTTTKGKS
ncbi:MAG: XRE family transcriptional regulator [Actinomycetales bacterium]|nr:MAG: XRE family transcriptional regulator [Actinomycetales bacterium]